MASPRQLEMLRADLEGLPPLQVPAGYALRTYQPGDEEHWARIMNQCIGEGWTAARCRAELVDRPEFHPRGCFLVTRDGVPVGSATAWNKGSLPPGTGYVHMVGVEWEERGRGLGRLVTLAVLHCFREHGYQRALLHTDDWRLAAVAVYLKLGFEPAVPDEAHRARWDSVRARLSTSLR